MLDDWAKEMATEQAVTLEFMNQTDRDSIYKYAKAEEISELMEEVYQVNNAETRQSARQSLLNWNF